MKISSLHRTASVRTTSLVSLLTNSDSEQSTSTAKRRNVLSSEPTVESQPGAMVSSSDESLSGSLHRLSLATTTSSPMDDSTKSDDSDWGHFCKVEEGHAKPAEPPEKPVVVRRKLSIFEQLKQRNKKKTSAMGWSSVPL